MGWLIYDKRSGEVLRFIGALPDDMIEQQLQDGELAISGEERFDGYVSENVFVRFPDRPSIYHQWDWDTKLWKPNIDAARSAIKKSIERELGMLLYMPCNGFDADSVSRERIAGMIARLQRGDGLPAGWSGWRDASNVNRWADSDASTVLENLTALSRAIEDREQALLVASWQHKAAISSLDSIDDLLAYDVTQGWPQ